MHRKVKISPRRLVGCWLVAGLTLVGCSPTSTAETLPACQSPHPAPTIDPAAQSQVASVRTKYQALVDERDPARVAANQRLADAARRGDNKALQAAIADALARPHPIHDFLLSVDLPSALRSDVDAYIGADNKVRAADEAIVRANDDKTLDDAFHKRNVALRVNENAVNQFRVDVGTAALDCPYTGP